MTIERRIENLRLLKEQGIREGIRYTLDQILVFLPAKIAATVEQETFEMLWNNYKPDWDELPNGN